MSIKDSMKKKSKLSLIYISGFLWIKVWSQFCIEVGRYTDWFARFARAPTFPTGGLKFLINESIAVTGDAKIDLFPLHLII